jgi:hypothetical protein
MRFNQDTKKETDMPALDEPYNPAAEAMDDMLNKAVSASKDAHLKRIEAARFIDGGYTVHESDGGSYVIEQAGAKFDPGRIWKRRGFSNWGDMIEWLRMAHQAHADGAADPAKFDPINEAGTDKVLTREEVMTEINKVRRDQW